MHENNTGVDTKNYASLSGKVHIHVCVPCYSCLMRKEFFLSLMQLQASATRYGVALSMDFMGNESLITRGRNILAAKFLKSSATHLLFIDADIAFHADTVFKLAAFDRDVVTAVYPKKHIDWQAIRSKLQTPGGTQEKVHAMGLDYNINVVTKEANVVGGSFIKVLDSATGFFMIKREALQRVVDHYRDSLSCVNDITNSKDVVPEYVAVFDTMICPDTKRYLSEDYAFCRRAQAVDIDIWADITSPLAHIGSKHLAGDITQRCAVVFNE